MLLGMHLGIAVLLGLPLFSGAMIVADAVFLPDRFYRFLGRMWRRTFSRAALRRKGTTTRTGNSTCAGTVDRLRAGYALHRPRGVTA
jgi:hypothetical protein